MRSIRFTPAVLKQSADEDPDPDSEYPAGCVPVFGPPPQGFHFPEDLGNHPQQSVEWWWYLGNFDVLSPDPTVAPRHFGVELCFLRKSSKCDGTGMSALLASLAVADADANKLYVHERLGFFGLNAFVESEPFVVRTDDWRVEQRPGGSDNDLRMVVYAGPETTVDDQDTDSIEIDVAMTMVKGNALTGKDGFDGNIHLAQPRITAHGTLTVNRVDYPVTGIFWVEHQWLTPGSGEGDPQWNWFTFQFGDRTELTMGIVHPVPTDPAKLKATPLGCFLDADAKPTYLMMDDIQWTRSHPWTSPRTGIFYPGIEHDITIPSLGFQLHATPFIEDNEVCSRLSGDGGSLDALFYEGASRVSGTRAGIPVQGVGYTELVGFEKDGKILD